MVTDSVGTGVATAAGGAANSGGGGGTAVVDAGTATGEGREKKSQAERMARGPRRGERRNESEKEKRGAKVRAEEGVEGYNMVRPWVSTLSHFWSTRWDTRPMNWIDVNQYCLKFSSFFF